MTSLVCPICGKQRHQSASTMLTICIKCKRSMRATINHDPVANAYLNTAQGEVLLSEVLKALFTAK